MGWCVQELLLLSFAFNQTCILPKKVSPSPSAKLREFVSLTSASDRSIIVWRMVDVTSPLHVPMATKPQAIAAIPMTWKTVWLFYKRYRPAMNVKVNILTSRFDFGSARTGRIRDNTSCLLEPAYARPSLEKKNKQTKVTRLFFPSVTRQKWIWVHPTGVKPMTFYLLEQMLYYWTTKDSLEQKQFNSSLSRSIWKKSVFSFFGINY